MHLPIKKSGRKPAKPLSSRALYEARERETQLRKQEVLDRFRCEVEEANRRTFVQIVPDETDQMTAQTITEGNSQRQNEMRDYLIRSGERLKISLSDVDQILRDVLGKLNG